ncbi:protein of unknown function [Bradyrhizobium vignae]|uniref:Uncharacterized protein n=1 Tax=Bradyrhizobium vignae TaxID=1549949 RepID=A0A2U3QBW3_9BRAD|nr:protein of unknown function [Bradyrhizobium vignae]
MPELRKILRFEGKEGLIAAKSSQLQAEVAGLPIPPLMAKSPLFHGFC